jgi:hypothetical protein
VSDLVGFASLQAAGLEPAQAMEKCFRLGLEPAGAGQVLKNQGASDIGALESLASDAKREGPAAWPLAGNPEKAVLEVSQAFSIAVPPKGIFANQNEGPQWWVNKQALAYTLGLDPVVILMTPEITDEKVVELIQLSGEWDEFSLDDLQRIISDLIKKSS